jgi:hypothetical protein
MLCSTALPVWWCKYDVFRLHHASSDDTAYLVDDMLNTIRCKDTILVTEIYNFMHPNGPFFTLQ